MERATVAGDAERAAEAGGGVSNRLDWLLEYRGRREMAPSRFVPEGEQPIAHGQLMRDGKILYLVVMCPWCGLLHVHGGEYELGGPGEDWFRVSHCAHPHDRPFLAGYRIQLHEDRPVATYGDRDRLQARLERTDPRIRAERLAMRRVLRGRPAVRPARAPKPPRPARVPKPDPSPRSISAGTRTRVLERAGFRCRRCGASPDDGAKLVVDHITPVARGGTRALDNLQALCSACNAGKSDRTPHAHDLRPFPNGAPTA